MATLPRRSSSTARSQTPSPTRAATAAIANNFTGEIAKKIKAFGDLLEIKLVPVQSPPQAGPTPQAAQTPRRILRTVDAAKQFLPGQPRIPVNDNDVIVEGLNEYLKKVHLTKEIDALLPYMRYIFVQTPSFRHITPLHHQEARERKIIVDEHPGLHLVWYYERIFVKPIPAYFYSPSFWEYIETDDDKDVLQAALGFMRSYYLLIQYETDYLLACKLHLIPKKPNGNLPSYEEYCGFMTAFQDVIDDQCSRRFHYGELRLSRINRTAFFCRFNLAYFHIYPQWGSFLQHFMAPIITVFAIATVVLNSMQVSLAALAMPDTPDGNGWPSFVGVSKWFPIIIMILIAGVVGGGLVAIFIMAIKDVKFADKTRRKKKRGDQDAGEKSHGVIW